MTSEDRVKILEGAKEAFFQAMLDGYAGGENRRSIKVKSNGGCTTSVTFVFGDFIVKDEWHTYPNSIYSFGSTLITYLGKPVWMMSYGGWYNDEAINFLKKVLAVSYRAAEFNGGRGPYTYEIPYMDENNPLLRFRLMYRNESEGVFWSFRGNEYVYRQEVPDIAGSKTLGHHHFFGGTII